MMDRVRARRLLLGNPAQAIFVSYRVSDASPAVAWLVDELGRSFGRRAVFHDKASLEASQDWPAALESAIDGSSVLVVVVGTTWESAALSPGHAKQGQLRLEDPDDWVRREIQLGGALERPIIHVIADRPHAPDAALLERLGLDALARVSALRLRTDDRITDFAAIEAAVARLGRLHARQRRAWHDRLAAAIAVATSLLLGLGLDASGVSVRGAMTTILASGVAFASVPVLAASFGRAVTWLAVAGATAVLAHAAQSSSLEGGLADGAVVLPFLLMSLAVGWAARLALARVRGYEP